MTYSIIYDVYVYYMYIYLLWSRPSVATDMNIVHARQFVMGVVGLSSYEQIHLKQLLNRGFIIPLAVIGSTVDDLREIISLNPLPTGNSLLDCLLSSVYSIYLSYCQ